MAGIEPVPTTQERAGGLSRVAAGLAGCVLLLVGTLFTLGVAAGAFLGVVLAWWIQRRRGRRLTRPGAWIAATSTATLLIIIGAALMFAMLPDGALTEAMTEARAAEPPPPPAWLERLGADTDPATDRIVTSTPFTVYFGILGASISLLILGSIAGTLGWAASLLAGFAVRGHWPLRPQPVD
jgi:hypothetical protein